MNLIDIIDGYGKIQGAKGKAAHIHRGCTLTYEMLTEKSDALAAFLIEEFGEDKTPIIVFGHKENEMLICFLACVKSGHAYIPVDSSLPDERIKDIIESSASKIIFSIEQLNDKPNSIIVIDKNEMSDSISRFYGKHPDKKYCVSGDDNYYIIYTSGSTGKPKGVQITLSCLESFVNWGLKLCSLDRDRDYVFMNQAPFSFDLSVMDLYISLASGSTLYSIDKTMIADFRELFAAFKESNINIWVSTPSFAEMCLADKSFNEELMPNLELLMFCGETLSNACVKKLYDRFKNIKVINTYGPTEATVAVTSVDVDATINKKYEPLPVGYEKEGCIIIIVDSLGNEVMDGQKGEIVIAGDSVSPGYYRNTEGTDRVFKSIEVDGIEKRSYRTGDEGYIENGLLFFCGRIDFQVKLNGFRIELEDIENNLRKIEFIDNAIVIPVFRNGKIQYLASVVTLNREISDSEFNIGIMIKNELKKLLPDYMVPRKVMVRDSLPMTVNGKINRKVLIEELK